MRITTPRAGLSLQSWRRTGRWQRPNERQAYEILARYSDHPFSFVDATSFALKRENRMRHAFAFDAHFRAAGFLTIPGDVQVLP